MAEKLTKTRIDAANWVSGGRQVLRDHLVSGFGLRVNRSNKTYFVRYRPSGGGRNARPKEYTIGPHGSPWTLETARKEAQRILGLVRAGEDPQAIKQDERHKLNGDTVPEAVELFVTRHVKRHLKPHTQRDYLAILEKQVAKRWKTRRLDEISRSHIARLLGDRDETPAMARLTYSVLSKFFNWCLEQGLLETSPMTGMKGPPTPKARERILSDDEVRLFWQATGEMGWPFGPAFRFLLLTGQRLNEVGGAVWEEFDTDTGEWVIPPERSKNGREHRVDMGPNAVAILKAQNFLGPYVFGSTGTKPLQGWSKAKKRLDDLMAKLAESEGLASPPPWRNHDLRRTMASGMQGIGITADVIERILNHRSGVQGGLVAVYQRHDLREQRKTASVAWERYLLDLIGTSDACNVVSMRGGDV